MKVVKNYFEFDNRQFSRQHSIRLPVPVGLSKDEQRFGELAEMCFSRHVNDGGYKKKLNEMHVEKRGVRLFTQSDVSSLYLSSYYKFPRLVQLDKSDIQRIVSYIESDDVVKEISDYLQSSGQIVSLVGGVGEGKSTLLRRLLIDLENEDSGCIAVIVDFQEHQSLIDKNDVTQLLSAIGLDILDTLRNRGIEIPDEIAKTEALSEKSSISGNLSIRSFLVKMGASIGSEKIDSEAIVKRKVLQFYQQLEEANSIIENIYGKKLVIIFDNIDTVCYTHERFMLFTEGFSELKGRIKTIKDIVHKTSGRRRRTNISFLFALRPYVYNHIFVTRMENSFSLESDAVFKIAKAINQPTIDDISYEEFPIVSRLKLLGDLVKIVKNSKDVNEGTSNILEKKFEDFEKNISVSLRRKHSYLKKMYHLSDQGFRSIVDCYKGVVKTYKSELFSRYFTHNILYSYLLSNRSIYSQMNVDKSIRKDSHFPNLFLVRCDHAYNAVDKVACTSHLPIFMLKYLILVFCYCEKNTTVFNIINFFSSYPVHAVRLCIGSLGTANEYNCLDITVDGEFSELPSLEKSISVKLTRRGKYLIRNWFCFGFESLQLYADDWLMHRPILSRINFNDKYIENMFYGANVDKINYNYLFSDDKEFHKNATIEMIRYKVKQSILFLYYILSASNYEKNAYNDTWKKLDNLCNKNCFFKIGFLDFSIMNDLIREIEMSAWRAAGKDDLLLEEIKDFRRKYEQKILDAFTSYFSDFLSDQSVKFTLLKYANELTD